MSAGTAVAGGHSSSPLSAMNNMPIRLRRQSPLFSRSSQSPTSDVPSDMSRPHPKVSFQQPVDDDEDDDDEHDSPVLSVLAQKLLESEGGADANKEKDPVTTTSRYPYGKTPHARTEKSAGSYSASSNERHRTSPFSEGQEFVTPAPRTRTRRPINAYHSNIGSSGSSGHNSTEKQPETERKPSYSSLHASVSRATTSNATASAMRWRRPGAAHTSVPRRGPWPGMNPQTTHDGQEAAHETEKEESPVRKLESPGRTQTEEPSMERSPSNSYEALKRRSHSSIVRRRSPALSPVNSQEALPSIARSRSPSQEIEPQPGSPLHRPSSYELKSQLEPQSLPNPESPTPVKYEPVSHHISYGSSNKENIPPAPPPVFNIGAVEPVYKKPVVAPIQMEPHIDAHKSHDRHNVLQRRSANTPLRPAPPPPPKMSIIDTATAAAGASTATHSALANGRGKQVVVNKRVYTRLDRLGKGGSGKVHRVMAENEKLFALKRVQYGNNGHDTIQSLKQEIELLTKLKDERRVVTLYDWEINERKKTLSLIMECGEATLAALLNSKYEIEQSALDISFVRHYWREMLLCLQVVHKHDIVHSDLKPANFVIVQGCLKLIDFGIAGAIADDTVNVHRDNLVGTTNYMSPEALQNTLSPASFAVTERGPKLIKIGPASDVWSLGCILYQMVYGRTPFAHVKEFAAKIHAILQKDFEIEFPEHGIGGVVVPKSLIRVMKACLERDKNKRATLDELLSDKEPFLNPDRAKDGYVDISLDTLRLLLESVVNSYENNGKPDKAQITEWAKDVYVRLDRKMLENGRR